ncbi:hypothetical protein VCSRO10_2844 [Vibrio cholerae]|nr:hypothetical protein VCSRO10_2844 [Vibrio cholerae]
MGGVRIVRDDSAMLLQAEPKSRAFRMLLDNGTDLVLIGSVCFRPE